VLLWDVQWSHECAVMKGSSEKSVRVVYIMARRARAKESECV
jgi:hypothetical protein